MAELEIPNRLLSALRYFIGAALPFIFFWVAVEKALGGQSYRALTCLGAVVLSFVVAVYWHRIIPARFRDVAKELEYLRTSGRAVSCVGNRPPIVRDLECAVDAVVMW
jgi:hypothetical protein